EDYESMHGEEYEPMYEEEYEPMYEEEYEPMYEEKHEPMHEEEHEPMYEKVYEPELQLDESEVSELSQVQKSNSICFIDLLYGNISKKKKKTTQFTKVPELKKLNVKEGISVVDMLNNKSG
ncbi:20138_t:CDS:2, partial [Racocetra persica]